MSSNVKKMLAAAALTLLTSTAISLFVFVCENGGIDEVLQLPAVAVGAWTTKQDGFSLVEVCRGRPDDSDYTLPNGAKMFLAAPQSSGDTVLWIAPPLLPPTRLLRANTIHDSGSLQSFYNIQAVSSAGDRFRLPWHYEGGCLEGGGEPCIDTRAASTSPHIIATVIPSGYPDDITYFDVSIADPYGHRASWHIGRLPKMHLASIQPGHSSCNYEGAAFTLNAVRASPGDGSIWPAVNLSMVVQRLPDKARHQWALFERPSSEPTLEWQPIRLPWMQTTFDQSNQRALNVYWMFNRYAALNGTFSTISSPYIRRNDLATFHGIIDEYETRSDSVHLKNVRITTIRASDAGLHEDTYCIDLPKKVELISGSGLTFELPAQHSSQKAFLQMTANSLNLRWHLAPVTPGHNSETAAYLPDSPLCKRYHHPAAVWFEAFANGIPLGVCAGLPDDPHLSGPIMVHFPAPIGLPETIHDLKITVHQRVDLQRVAVTLTAKIVAKTL